MTHFYGTEEELKIWLAEKTEKALADIALGRYKDIAEVKRDFAKKKKVYAKV
jgi:hypothetical protein